MLPAPFASACPSHATHGPATPYTMDAFSDRWMGAGMSTRAASRQAQRICPFAHSWCLHAPMSGTCVLAGRLALSSAPNTSLMARSVRHPSAAPHRTRSPAHPLTRSPAHPHTRSPAHPLTRSPAHLLICSSAHLLICSSAHLLTRSSARTCCRRHLKRYRPISQTAPWACFGGNLLASAQGRQTKTRQKRVGGFTCSSILS